MSYDLRVYVKAETPRLNGDPYVVVGIPEYDSPTYNLRPMFVECMGWNYSQGEVYPLRDVLPHIDRGIAELSRNPDAYRHLNPENGWGDIGSALTALKSLRECIDECAGDWPVNALYMSW